MPSMTFNNNDVNGDDNADDYLVKIIIVMAMTK